MLYYNKETRNENGDFYRRGDWGVEDIRGDDLAENDNFTTVMPDLVTLLDSKGVCTKAELPQAAQDKLAARAAARAKL